MPYKIEKKQRRCRKIQHLLPSKINPLNIPLTQNIRQVVMEQKELVITLENLTHKEFVVVGDGVKLFVVVDILHRQVRFLCFLYLANATAWANIVQ